MAKNIKPIRMVVVMLSTFIFAAVCLLALYDLQIINGDAYYERSVNTIVTSETVKASRGTISDRYGRLLVSNRVSYDIKINRSDLVSGRDPNGVLVRLAECANSFSTPYTDTFPVTFAPPFEYLPDMSQTQRKLLDDYIDHFDLNEKITAPELMRHLRMHYSIPESFSDEEARIAAGIRYELEVRTLWGGADYVFASDVSIEMISSIGGYNMTGVYVANTSVREYHTDYAAHLLGYIGLMNEEDYKKYGKLGYPMNAVIGKSGVESAFEEYLHGQDGEIATTKDSSGEVTAVLYTKDPEPGDNVVLTIDIMLQQAAEDALSSTIAGINETRAEKALEEGKPFVPTTAGAAAVVQVGTGDVLALASYPTYNLNTFKEDYSSLLSDPALPLFNRATLGTYSPGSTFKICTAIAALSNKVISTGSIIHDEGKFTVYQGFQPTCWTYPGSHGDINVTEAITVSCNYFFYSIGLNLGIDKLTPFARSFGFGVPTGLEISESSGILATREYKEKNEGLFWDGGDTLQASIGQSYSLFTPAQIASYCATIASRGTHYSLHLLDSVKTNDNTVTLREYQNNVLTTVDTEDEYWQAMFDGMLGVSKDGTASSVFGNYSIDVCSKTGTVQLGEDIENNAVFIAFAPYDDPEIALAIVVENGGSGSNVTEAAKKIFDYYFTSEAAADSVPAEGVLIR